jgi:hypothetical protein
LPKLPSGKCEEVTGHGDRERPLLLTAILSIHNTDPAHPITILLVDYYDTDGQIIRRYLPKPVTLKPMAHPVRGQGVDAKGGSGGQLPGAVASRNGSQRTDYGRGDDRRGRPARYFLCFQGQSDKKSGLNHKLLNNISKF